MSKKLLEKTRSLNSLLQQNKVGEISYQELSEILGSLMDSNVYLVDTEGSIIGSHFAVSEDSATIKSPETGSESLEAKTAEALLNITDTEINLTDSKALALFPSLPKTANKFHTIVPIIGGTKRLGTAIFVRYEPKYDDEDIILAEYGATLVGYAITREEAFAAETYERTRAIVIKAIETLSYSEIEAIKLMFDELGGKEGLLVASRIADKSGITRSVIVNALRKLESAGVIESRSLGMKGTHIKVVEELFLTELNATRV
jgi:transcriptional pleiotropic repressor